MMTAFPAAAMHVKKPRCAVEGATARSVPQELSSEAIKGINSFFKEGLGIAEVEKPVLVGTSQPTYERPDALQVVCVTIGPDRDRVAVKVDPYSGRVLSFLWDQQWKREWEEAGNRTHSDAISVDSAFKSMQPLLAYYGQPTGRGEHEIEMEDYAGVERLDDLYGAKWVISENLTHEGLQCPHRLMLIEVSAYSGKILHTQCWPVIPPKNKEPWIGKEEAAEHARAWLKQHSEDLKTGDVHVNEDALNAMVQTVALPNPTWMKYGTKAPAEKPGEAYVCWNVPVYFVDSYSGKIESRLVVRADNGSVIDAYGIYPRLLPVGGVPPIASPADKVPSPLEAPSQ